MAIKCIGQDWCPDAKDYLKVYVCDTDADLANLPPAPYGSTVIVAESGKTAVVNASGQWIDTDSGDVILGTSGSTGDSGDSDESPEAGVSSWHDLLDRPFYDTRTTVTDEYEVTGLANARNYIKVADSVGFDFDKPMVFEGEFDGDTWHFNAVWGRTSPEAPMMLWAVELGGVGGDYNLGAYIANETEAEWIWDSDEPNPFTTGLYMSYYASMYGVRDIKYSFTYSAGELKTLDLKFMPESLQFGETVTESDIVEYDSNNNYSVMTGNYVKISDCTPTIEDFKDGATVTGRMNGETFATDLILDNNVFVDEFGIVVLMDYSMAIIPSHVVGVDLGNGFSFPESGIYARVDGVEHLSFTIHNYEFKSVKIDRIDSKFMPEGYPSVERSTVALLDLGYDDCEFHSDNNYEHTFARDLVGFVPVVGNTYTVTIDGVTFDAVCREYSDGYVGMQWYLGNGRMYSGAPDTGEPFCLMFPRNDYYTYNVRLDTNVFGTNGFNSITISYTVETITPIDPKFLPEGVGGGIDAYDVIIGVDTYLSDGNANCVFLKGNHDVFRATLEQYKPCRVLAIHNGGSSPWVSQPIKVRGSFGSSGFYVYMDFLDDGNIVTLENSTGNPDRVWISNSYSISG